MIQQAIYPCNRRSKISFYFFATILIIFLLISSAKAQNGWELIKKNDNVAAKKTFVEALKKDSTDINALYGIIYIAELEQDDILFEKYINSLINNYKLPEQYLLFDSYYDGNTDDLKLNEDSSKKAETTLTYKKAKDLFTNRKFKESKNAYDDILGNYEWSVIGPFRNISGYGFVKEYDVEKEKFNSAKSYDNGYDLKFNWVKRAVRNYNNGIVIFTDNLSGDYSSSVYFANTYIKVPETVKAQFRFARNTPVKIWLDDYLVFQDKDNTNFSWDNDIIDITLTKGVHRILVKCATLPDEDNSNFLAYYDGMSNTNFKSDLSNYFDFESMLKNIGNNNEKYPYNNQTLTCQTLS